MNVFDDFIFLPAFFGYSSIKNFSKINITKLEKKKELSGPKLGLLGANRFCTSRVVSPHSAVKQRCGKIFWGLGAWSKCLSENFAF